MKAKQKILQMIRKRRGFGLSEDELAEFGVKFLNLVSKVQAASGDAARKHVLYSESEAIVEFFTKRAA